MTKILEKPSHYGARLWPRDNDKILRISEYLEKTGDGSPVSFSDCVKWLLSLPTVERALCEWEQVENGE